MFLLDTNILSVTAPGRRLAVPGVTRWVRENEDSLYLSVMTIAEIEQGIQKLHRTGANRKAAGLREWLEAVSLLYQPRLLPFDLTVAVLLGRMADHAVGLGHTAEAADLIIAATAQAHGYTLVTRNVKHFTGLGVPLLNPYDTETGAEP